MSARCHNFFPALPLIMGLGISPAAGKVIDDGPQPLSQNASIAASLREAGQHTVHILYVHGIGQTSPGGSVILQKAICAYLKDCTVPKAPAQRDYADGGEFAPGAEAPAFEYMERPVWRSKEEWSASAPFVDHYVLSRTDGGPIVVDEINWWPLVFPLKCRAILAGETHLAGPNPSLLNLCSQPTQSDPFASGRYRAYAWVSPQDAKRLETGQARGALFNRWLKTSILDWGFSDAMMAVGSMHDLFREGMRQLFLKSVMFTANGANNYDWQQQLNNPHGIDREFIVVSHSLGSYLVFSTLNLDRHYGEPSDAPPTGSGPAAEDAAAQYILERTSLVYFFANQVPLLALANIRGLNAAPAQGVAPESATSAFNLLMERWRRLRETFAKRRAGGEEARLPQVVAWSDPSDLLSWHLPPMEGLIITNLYVRNTRWHWMIANPAAAHGNYATNKDVLRVMLGIKTPSHKVAAGEN